MTLEPDCLDVTLDPPWLWVWLWESSLASLLSGLCFLIYIIGAMVTIIPSYYKIDSSQELNWYYKYICAYVLYTMHVYKTYVHVCIYTHIHMHTRQIISIILTHNKHVGFLLFLSNVFLDFKVWSSMSKYEKNRFNKMVISIPIV